MQYNPYTEPQWRGAVASFETSLVPAENRIAGKLKAQLRDRPIQCCREFYGIDVGFHCKGLCSTVEIGSSDTL